MSKVGGGIDLGAPGTATNHHDDAVNLEVWVDQHAHSLFRYARVRVRDQHTAEELVQETFLAAVKAIHSFRGKE